MNKELIVDESETGESGEAYDAEMEARRILRTLPFSFESIEDL